MDAVIADTLAARRFSIFLLGAFAAWLFCSPVWASTASSLTSSASARRKWRSAWRSAPTAQCFGVGAETGATLAASAWRRHGRSL